MDAFSSSSSTPFRALSALLVGALLVLVVGRALDRRLPGPVAGAGLVLLVVAVLRSLSEAADVLAPGVPGLRTWLVGLLLAAGLAVGSALDRTGHPEVPVVAVVLAALPLFAPFDLLGLLGAGDEPSAWLADGRTALAGLLAAGALLALRPGPRTAGLAVAGLLLAAAVQPLLDAQAARAVVAGLVLGVLPAALVRRARDVEPAPAGLLAGVVLVLAVVAADAALGDQQDRAYGAQPGLQVVSNETYDEYFSGSYASLLQVTYRDRGRLVPSLLRGTSRTVRIAG